MEKRIEKLDEQISQIEAKLNDPYLCADTAETMTRVSGYYRPVSAFNDGKAEEVVQRLEYSIS